MTERADRIAVLDGLRAMAIILVLMRHLIRPFWIDMEAPFFPVGPVDLASLFINGWIGVDLFFVLSGYLITSHLMGRYFNEARQMINFRDYSKRRFLRIAPAYYVVLTIAILGLFPFYPYPDNTENLGWRYLYHLFFLQDYLPSDIVVVFWTLAVEMKFYLLAPFIILGLLRLPRSRDRFFVLGFWFAVMIALRYYTALRHPEIDHYYVYFEDLRSLFHLNLDGLLAGMICALLWKDSHYRAIIEKPAVANSLFFSGLGIFLFFTLVFGPLVDLEISLFDKVYLPLIIAAAFGAMLLGLRGGCAANFFFAWKGWFFVALISYSLYLVHLPLMYLAEVICKKFVDFGLFPLQMQMFLYLPFFLVVVTAGASLSYYFLERPFLREGRKRLS